MGDTNGCDCGQVPTITWDELQDAVLGARAFEAVRAATALACAGELELARMLLATADPRLVEVLVNLGPDALYDHPFMPTLDVDGGWMRLTGYELSQAQQCLLGHALPAGYPTYPHGRDDGACPICGDGVWGSERFEGATIPGSFGADFSLLRLEGLGWMLGFRQTGIGHWGGHIDAAFCPVCGKRLQDKDGPAQALDAPCLHCSEGAPYVELDHTRYFIARDWLGARLVVDCGSSGRAAVPLAYCPTCGERLTQDKIER